MVGGIVLRLNLEIKDDIYKRLKAEARVEGRTISDVVRNLVNVWLSVKLAEKKYFSSIQIERLSGEEDELS